MGLRLALGARSGQVFTSVIKQGMGLTVTGLAIGLVASLGLTGFLSSLLFRVEAHDPLTLTACVAFLGLVALAACSLPAHSAARTDPMRSLRTE